MRVVGLASLMLPVGCAAAPQPGPVGGAADPTPPGPPVRSDSPRAAAPAAAIDEPAAGAPVPEPEPEPREAVPRQPPPLPEGTVVLHVGSSTAGALGVDLKRELAERGIECILQAKESTLIPQWADEEMGLRRLLAAYDPDLVIVSLGGNEVTLPDPGQRAGAIRQLVILVGDRPCLWVGTPRWEVLPHTGLLDVIREHSSPCHFIDTDELVPDLEPLEDGVHPTYPERRRWARAMIRWLQHNRDPDGDRPWTFKEQLELPSEEAPPVGEEP